MDRFPYADLRVEEPHMQSWVVGGAAEIFVYIDNSCMSDEPQVDEALCNWDTDQPIGISFQLSVPAMFDAICESHGSRGVLDADGRIAAMDLRRQCIEIIERIDGLKFQSSAKATGGAQ